jgi:hypothetical protein
VEAAACGVPVMATDYSAMESEVRKLEGYPIKPAALYKELETGCLRAVPDNDLACKMFGQFFDLPEEERASIGKRTRSNFDKYFQWNLSGKKWEDYFDSVEIRSVQDTWASPPKIHQPQPKPQDVPESLSTNDLARWLIVNVLGDRSKINTFFEARLTRDLLYRSATSSTGGMYFNESSAAFDGVNHRVEFNFDIAYDQMHSMCTRNNDWEQRRVESMKQKGLIQ